MRRRQSLSLPLLLFEDPGSVLKGGVKVCKRPLVNEVLGLLLTEFFPDPDPQGRDTYTAWTLMQPYVCI